MSLAVANRYARALVDVSADAKNNLDPAQVDETLAAFEEAFVSSVELSSVLSSPTVPPARKRAVVAKLGESIGLAPLVRNFLYVLIDHRRVALLGDIRRSFQRLLDERLGLVRADVTTALPLDEAQRARVAAELSRLTGKQVRSEYSIDPALLGGVSARIGSTIYDGSVRGRLGSLRRQLTAEV